ncbi:MAG: hypothetical protein ACRBBW_00150 [Cellvibrionaceae bacterium]
MATKLPHPGMSPTGEPTTFQGCLERVNPSAASLDNLAGKTDDAPIMMLNFLRFRPRGDNTIYSLYGKQAAPEVNKVGSFVGYYGRALTDLPLSFGFDNTWDGVVIPVYHRRRSYLDLQQSTHYQLAIPYRSAGTSRRMLYSLADGYKLFSTATDVSELDESRKPLAIDDGEVVVVELLKFRESKSIENMEPYAKELQHLLHSLGANAVLSLATEEPVLSEQQWDYCMLLRFPRLELLYEFYHSKTWKVLESYLRDELDHVLRVASQAIAIPT